MNLLHTAHHITDTGPGCDDHSLALMLENNVEKVGMSGADHAQNCC